MKTCFVCEFEKELSEFDFRKQNNTYSGRCKECRRAYIRQHYIDNKKYYVDKADKRNSRMRTANRALLIDFLKKNPCVDCGNNDIEVLQFDHIDRALKKTEIHNLLTHSKEALFAEIAKCDIRCANCHIKRTRRQLGYWTYDN